MSLISTSTVLPLHLNTKQTHCLQPERLALLIDKSKSIKPLSQIHAFVICHGLESHPVLNFKLLLSYCSLSHLEHSVSLFNRTQNPSVYFYTGIIHGHAINDLHEKAFLFYVLMLSEDAEPNAFTLSAILKACPLESGKSLHCQVLKLGLKFDTYVRMLFNRMEEGDVVSRNVMIDGYARNVMIDGYAQNVRPNDALILFRQMLKAKVKHNEATLLAVLSACGQVGALELGRWIHSHMQYNGIPVYARMGSVLVDMYCKCGSLEDARTMFDGNKDNDVVAFNSMIVGYASHEFSQEALELYNNMSGIGHIPTEITFIEILSACVHAKRSVRDST
ncbi:unnamed protein product [Fraxinus pennsylvanica]|uniref:Pentatricopeptide repeat-containing protein n=1 Tax=Fraxinus pennsylvanica TaxID=56036 RepID=A0AAD2E005_9LAMI|nr:unnamed protein product [Fraxinus pennsylvanica]